jgi:Zn-dependent membrane protease YugP
MLGFDLWYFVFLAPGLLLAMWAQARVSMAYAEGLQVPSSSGITGAQAAAEIMRVEGVHGVAIEPVAGHLSDHYDPRDKVLRLSHENYQGRSLAALGVAAHEAGHAIQDAHGYSPLAIRNLMVPVASFGSGAAWLVLLAGFVLHLTGLVLVGIVLFGTTVVFQLINLPVEFDASRRARQALLMTGLVQPEEDRTVGGVLNAAAWTYVAATLTSILTLLYYLFRAGLIGGSSRDD